MGAGQVADRQHRGQRVDPGDADRLIVFQVLAVAEPGDQQRRVALDHEAGLSDALAPLHEVAKEGERLDAGCN